MTSNEILLRRVAAALVRSGDKITKAAVRKRIKGLAFVKDGKGYDTYDQRVDAAYKFASDFAVVRSRREFEKASGPPPADRQSRLLTMKRERFLNCVQRAAFRQTDAGQHMVCVRFVDTPEEVKALSWTGPGGVRASDKKTDSEHRYFIMKNWTTQVQDRGLALLDGKLTLYVGKMNTVANVQVFAATWVSQGDGCTLKTHRGHIARNGDYFTHGDTAEDAAKNVVGHRRLT